MAAERIDNMAASYADPCEFCKGKLEEQWVEYMDGWLYMGWGGKCKCGRTECEDYAGSTIRYVDGTVTQLPGG